MKLTRKGLLLCGGLLAAGAAGADEFMAMPGLWDMRIQAAGAAAQQDWRCVDEQADPWTAYVPAAGAGCALTPVLRTATALRWRQQCSGPAALQREGSLMLDSAQHYSGRIDETATVAGKPVTRHLQLEGTRKAACTSPSD